MVSCKNPQYNNNKIINYLSEQELEDDSPNQ
jgi:hypothetical protein